jgi:hypothetical protein
VAAAVVVIAGGIAATITMVRSGDGASPFAAAQTQPVPEDCPQPLAGAPVDPPDVRDFVFVSDREYERFTEPGLVELGAEIARVTCSIADQPAQRYAFWHEGNAGTLALGTPVRTVEGHDPRCRIAAVVDGETRVYATALEAEGDCRPEAGTGCPESQLLPPGHFTFQQWADGVYWASFSYSSVTEAAEVGRLDRPESDPRLGDQIGLITCNLQALTAEGERDREVIGDMTSGSAAGLPVGTELYAIVDVPVGCTIAAVVDGEVRQYIALEPDGAVAQQCPPGFLIDRR